MSLSLSLARLVVRLGKGPERSAEAVRAHYAQRSYPRPADITRKAQRVALISKHEVNGHPLFELRPKHQSLEPQVSRHVLYLHGGGFVRPLHWAHWDLCAALIKRLGCRVTLPTYPLLPEHQREDCYEHLEALCERLFERGEELIFCGDSAGAHLALSLCVRLKARGAQLPTKLILFCPWVDVSVRHPKVDEVAQRDPMLYPSLVREWGRWWAGELPPSDPTLNPLYADLKGLPPVSLFLAADDLLTPDALMLAERLREAGVEVALNVTPNAFHDFMAVTWTPEAQQVLETLSQQLSSKAL